MIAKVPTSSAEVGRGRRPIEEHVLSIKRMSADLSSIDLNQALLDWARRALEQGRHAAGLVLTDAAVKVRPTRQGLSQLGLAYLCVPDPHAAVSAFRRCLKEFPEEVSYETFYLLGLAQAQLGLFDQAAANIRIFAARIPPDHVVSYYLGSVLALRGSFGEANTIFGRDIAVPCGNGHTTSTRIIRLPLADDPIAHGGNNQPPFDRRVAPDDWPGRLGVEAVSLVYFVCCDSRYFRLFMEPFANSVVQKSGLDCLLHIHIINPDEDVLASMASLRAQRRNVVFSIEQVDLSGLTTSQQRTYYACARFFTLPDVVRRYRKPVLVADIDQMVVSDLTKFVKTGQGYDVGFIRFTEASYNIMSFISASVIFINANPSAEVFCEVLQNYLYERMRDPESLLWHLDQVALVVTYLRLNDLNYYFIPPATMQSDVFDGESDGISTKALFWSITYSIPQNSGKLHTRQFQQFAGELGV